LDTPLIVIVNIFQFKTDMKARRRTAFPGASVRLRARRALASSFMY
jgi:hypothetical protein